MYIAFNELSVHEEISNCAEKNTARNIINEFVKILARVKKHKEFSGLIATQDIHTFQVSSEYSIQDWLSDPLVDGKYKTFFRTLYSQRCNYIDNRDYLLNELQINVGGHKFSGIGCLVASEMNESVISLGTHELWLNEELDGILSTLDNETDEILNEYRRLNNISKEIHIDKLEEKLKSEDFSMISSGQDLWEKREALFPNLVFCESVKDQLYKDPQKFHIEQVAKKLLHMQQYFSEYDGIYNPKELGLHARTESETVKSNPDLKAFRLFKKPDGSEEYFYNHIGFTSIYCVRIHFLPDDANRKCYIGYIGKHLPTKKF
ncbi:hypothetical protein DWV12_14525 [Clostridium botulinum]|uniref:hypothetical protein n=1 Tax=Clostridium botulinum TaxID=1491 RepID=UPI00217D6D4C|nr:hypothetical protein [Clostridium botulinum]MCS6103526.1 hypothetical protein [Clostridium botulinum]MCS6108563.1 hypothetical protein [Clostridium botulinum]